MDNEMIEKELNTLDGAALYQKAEEFGKAKERDLEWKYLNASAEKGYPQAHYLLAAYLASGMYHNPTDEKKAFELMLQAADMGVEEAPYYVGNWYRRGFGTDQDLKQAEIWLRKDSSPKSLAQLALLLGDEQKRYVDAIQTAKEVLAKTKASKTKEVMERKMAQWQSLLH